MYSFGSARVIVREEEEKARFIPERNQTGQKATGSINYFTNAIDDSLFYMHDSENQ